MAGAVGAAGDKHANGWSIIATELDRSNKQCRERWINQVDPTINKGKWTEEEDAILKDALARLGEHGRLLTFFIAGLRFHTDGAVCQGRAGLRSRSCCRAARTCTARTDSTPRSDRRNARPRDGSRPTPRRRAPRPR